MTGVSPLYGWMLAARLVDHDITHLPISSLKVHTYNNILGVPNRKGQKHLMTLYSEVMNE